jgi:hypothetical protein
MLQKLTEEGHGHHNLPFARRLRFFEAHFGAAIVKANACAVVEIWFTRQAHATAGSIDLNEHFCSRFKPYRRIK